MQSLRSLPAQSLATLGPAIGSTPQPIGQKTLSGSKAATRKRVAPASLLTLASLAPKDHLQELEP